MSNKWWWLPSKFTFLRSCASSYDIHVLSASYLALLLSQNTSKYALILKAGLKSNRKSWRHISIYTVYQKACINMMSWLKIFDQGFLNSILLYFNILLVLKNYTLETKSGTLCVDILAYFRAFFFFLKRQLFLRMLFNKN